MWQKSLFGTVYLHMCANFGTLGLNTNCKQSCQLFFQWTNDIPGHIYNYNTTECLNFVVLG